jgi:hypothetical protein
MMLSPELKARLDALANPAPAAPLPQDISARLHALMAAPIPEAKIGRPTIGDEAMTPKERKGRHLTNTRRKKATRIGIIDFETDPFDSAGDKPVYPFLAVIYTREHPAIIIWDEDFASFKKRVVCAIEQFPDEYVFYAHNGGKFDYMFLISEIRGRVQFKGRAIMSATLGAHELRDSFHLIPEKLANMQKMDFDYNKMKRSRRQKHRQEIIDYCLSDCTYLLSYLEKFVTDYGLKISIGQAAMAQIRKHYKFARLTDYLDERLREYFFGGRVECLRGMGRWPGPLHLYDVNSMYPYVMATRQHPIGSEFYWRAGRPKENTIFIKLKCKNRGAMVRRGENNETSATFTDGVFYTTIWEYEIARKYGLIRDVEFLMCVDCKDRTDFSKFIDPLYQKRLLTKTALKTMGASDPRYQDTKKDDLFYKLLMNNGYGKFAQNPRRFKENYITDADGQPEAEWFESINEIPDAGIRAACSLPRFQNGSYAIWDKPSPSWRFNNVATAASITGAARAVLLEAIQNAREPIYCDTDSIICRGLDGVRIDGVALGAWDLEASFDEVIITGKKQYACKVAGQEDCSAKRFKIRCKGASQTSWTDFETLLRGETVVNVNNAPTLLKTGKQFYLHRNIKATAAKLAAA